MRVVPLLVLIGSLVLFVLACALAAVDFDKGCSTDGEPELATLWQQPRGDVETTRGLRLELHLLPGDAPGVEVAAPLQQTDETEPALGSNVDRAQNAAWVERPRRQHEGRLVVGRLVEKKCRQRRVLGARGRKRPPD